MFTRPHPNRKKLGVMVHAYHPSYNGKGCGPGQLGQKARPLSQK
jgi:hypothetical protein